ncbi:MAG: cysteine-rich CWC family protein [Rubrivivax sp.]|nr:cysteine-rich CWC family protein [Rubrivivax sp.]
MNAAAAPDTCPRCGSGFSCGAAGPAPCACTTLTLSAVLQAQLQVRYSGCLCLNCLRELAAAQTSDTNAAAAPRESA